MTVVVQHQVKVIRDKQFLKMLFVNACQNSVNAHWIAKRRRDSLTLGLSGKAENILNSPQI